MVSYYALKSDIIFSGKNKPYYLHINITNIFIKITVPPNFSKLTLINQI